MLLNWGFGENSWESLDCKEIKPVNSKGDKPWVFIGRTDTETEASILWPPDGEGWLIRKDPNAGKDWRQEEKGMTGWDGQMASPTWWTCVWASSRSWWWTGKPGVLQSMGSQGLDTTERLNNNNSLSYQYSTFYFILGYKPNSLSVSMNFKSLQLVY